MPARVRPTTVPPEISASYPRDEVWHLTLTESSPGRLSLGRSIPVPFGISATGGKAAGSAAPFAGRLHYDPALYGLGFSSRAGD